MLCLVVFIALLLLGLLLLYPPTVPFALSLLSYCVMLWHVTLYYQMYLFIDWYWVDEACKYKCVQMCVCDDTTDAI